jgi:hypothetical protein
MKDAFHVDIHDLVPLFGGYLVGRLFYPGYRRVVDKDVYLAEPLLDRGKRPFNGGLVRNIDLMENSLARARYFGGKLNADFFIRDPSQTCSTGQALHARLRPAL